MMAAEIGLMPRTCMAEGSDDRDGHPVGSSEHMTDNEIELSPEAQLVQRMAQLVADHSSYSASRAGLIIGRYVDWLCRTKGMPTLHELALNPQTIDLYVRDFLAEGVNDKRIAKSSLAAYRSVLKRASEIALPRDDRNQIAEVSQDKDPMAPYTEDVVKMFQPWMRGQRTELMRRKATALGTLGLGCGLRAGEVNTLRRIDVVDPEDVVLAVTSGDTMREIPMLPRWQPAFRRLIADLEPDDYIFGAPKRRVRANGISEFVSDSNGLLKPSTYRMRSTWIVGRLVAGVDLPTLLRAAGLSKLEAATDYLRYLPSPTDETFARLRTEVKL